MLAGPDGYYASPRQLGFPETGYIMIGETKAHYSEIRTIADPLGGPNPVEILYLTGVDATNVGLDGTVQQTEWDAGVLVEFIAEAYYEPLYVTVDGIKAKNITDYRNRDHPAFALTSTSTLEYQYLQIGRDLFFNRPIKNAVIDINYRYLVAYLQLQAILRCTYPGRPVVTPQLDNYRLKIQTARHYANQIASSRT